MGVYEDNFAEVFSGLLKKAEISCYDIAEYTHLDQSYLSRLRNGIRNNPRHETVMKISLALVRSKRPIRISDIEKLFRSVGRSLNLKDYYDPNG